MQVKEAMPRGGQLPLDEVVIQNQFKYKILRIYKRAY
jgi:hypothetical protein